MSKLALAIGALVMAGGAMAANTDAVVSATVLAPITVTKDADLIFGNVVQGNGNVTVSTAGARDKDGTKLLPASTGVTAAKFTVGGSAGKTFAITTSSGTDVLVSGINKMSVTFLTEIKTGAATTATGITAAGSNDATGTLDATTLDAAVYVGGILAVDPLQVAGIYAGAVTLTAEYN